MNILCKKLMKCDGMFLNLPYIHMQKQYICNLTNVFALDNVLNVWKIKIGS